MTDEYICSETVQSQKGFRSHFQISSALSTLLSGVSGDVSFLSYGRLDGTDVPGSRAEGGRVKLGPQLLKFLTQGP